MKKKFQVFVSSTYLDLIDERQVAVSSILNTGHIPAGMELFKAGNNSQLNTVKKWIDESDVYLLILGGRYGSIEESSNTSYTEVEYRYAIDCNIPVFSLVLSDLFLYTKAALLGKNTIFEHDQIYQYNVFKKFVMSKVVRMVNDIKDIQINIPLALQEISNEYILDGWIRTSNQKYISKKYKDELDDMILKKKEAIKELSIIKEEIESLTIERNNLLNKIYLDNELLKSKSSYQNTTEQFSKLKLRLQDISFDYYITDKKYLNKHNLFELLPIYHHRLSYGVSYSKEMSPDEKYIYDELSPHLLELGLISEYTQNNYKTIVLTQMGQNFIKLIF